MVKTLEGLTLTVGDFLLLVLLVGGELERVEDTSGVTDITRGKLVALEEGVLAHATRVLDVLPPSDLDVVEEDELDHEKSRGGSEVLDLTGVVPQGRVDQTDLGQNLGHQHTCNSEHSPSSVLELGLDVPVQGSRVLSKTEGVESVVSGQAEIQTWTS